MRDFRPASRSSWVLERRDSKGAGAVRIPRPDAALHALGSPVDLEFRGHSLFYLRSGCFFLPRTVIVGRQNGSGFWCPRKMS